MKYPFSCDITDDDLGIITVYDFECQIEVEFEGYEPIQCGVYVDGKSLFSSSDDHTQWLAARVAALAETDFANHGNLYQTVIADEYPAYGRAASYADRVYQANREVA